MLFSKIKIDICIMIFKTKNMKNMMLFSIDTRILQYAAVIFLMISFLNGQAQNQNTILATVADSVSHAAIPFASVAVLQKSDSTIVAGTITRADGSFSISSENAPGNLLRVSFVGYRTFYCKIKNGLPDTLFMRQAAVEMQAAEVTGKRIRAKSEAGKTTYFIDQKMHEISKTGLDLLTYIPGVRMNFMQQLSLEGQSNIMILVDGMRRDAAFIRQLDPARIRKVEVISSPGPGYAADVSGVINIVLNKKQHGLSGHLSAELPTDRDKTYIFPGYGLNYSLKKFSFHTAYNGEISRFRLTDHNTRIIGSSPQQTTISNVQQVMQNNWSHRFHLGVDYDIDTKNTLTFYGYFNPWSSEHNGTIDIMATEPGESLAGWSAARSDSDIHFNSFYSLFVDHGFSREGSALTLEASFAHVTGNSTTTFTADSTAPDVKSISRPLQDLFRIKTSYTTPVGEIFRLDAGSEMSTTGMRDREEPSFHYRQEIIAAFGKVSVSFSKFEISSGFRTEIASDRLTGEPAVQKIALLPYLDIGCSISPASQLKITARRSISRPGINRLNPATTIEDPFFYTTGNPDLHPSTTNEIFAEYNLTANGQFLSTRIFFSSTRNTIAGFTHLNETGIPERRYENMGRLSQFGFQLKGALKLLGVLGLSPYFRYFHTVSHSPEFGPVGPAGWSYESGLSATAALGLGLAASVQFQYNSPVTYMQTTYYGDPLYFVTLEKTFGSSLRVGVRAGLPFAGSFIYAGQDTKGRDVQMHYRGEINLQQFPVWLQISYRFKSGKEVKDLQRKGEPIPKVRMKGF